MDITVVSLLPWALNELKPGIIPEQYYIPPCVNGIPGVIHINDVRANLYIRDGKTFPVTFTAEELANSLVNDYWRASLQTTEDARPAMFWVLGKYSPEEILGKFSVEIAEAKKRQNRWFMNLIRMADDDWAKTGQHRMITDVQRHAARSLGQLNKPWMQNLEPSEFVKCPACATLVDTNAALCQNCGFVTNRDKAKQLGISDSTVHVKR